MDKGNVLIMGNSGVGKSTLINAIFESDVAQTANAQTEGVTKRIQVYDKEGMPFRLIDTIGFEPGFLRNFSIKRAVKRYTQSIAKSDNNEEYINMIWFCIDGTSPRLFDKTINDFIGAIKGWRTIPICVVITKSYSSKDTKENVETVRKAIEKRHISSRVVDIIPVVALPYVIDEGVFKESFGIDKLIECTNNNMPEGMRAAKRDVEAFILDRKNMFAHIVISVSTLSGVGVCAVPLPIPDAAPLTAIESAEVVGIAKIYGLENDFKSKGIVQYFIEGGAIAIAGKQIAVILKAIPGVALSATVINSIVGGSIIAVIGKVAQYSCEQIYLGNKTVDEADWIKNMLENEFSKGIQNKLKRITERIQDADGIKPKEIANIIIEEIFKKNDK